MSESKSISQLTIIDAVKIINDIVVNAIIDLDFKVEEFTTSGFTLSVKGLKFRFLYYNVSDGSIHIYQFNYSNLVEMTVLKLSYDNDIILPILKDVVDNGRWSIKATELTALRQRTQELELELA